MLEVNERLPFVWKTRKFRGEFKWNGHPFSGKNSNTFRRYYLFPIFTEATEIFYTTCLDYQCQASSREKAKNYRYFINGTTQSRSCFLCQKKYQYHLTEIFHRNFRTNGKRSKCSKVPCLRKQRKGRCLNLGPPDPELEVLTTRPHKPPLCTVYRLEKDTLLYFTLTMRRLIEDSQVKQ